MQLLASHYRPRATSHLPPSAMQALRLDVENLTHTPYIAEAFNCYPSVLRQTNDETCVQLV